MNFTYLADLKINTICLDEQLEFTKAPLVIHLFEMLPQFIHGVSPHFPPKKVILTFKKISKF